MKKETNTSYDNRRVFVRTEQTDCPVKTDGLSVDEKGLPGEVLTVKREQTDCQERTDGLSEENRRTVTSLED